MMNGKMDVDHTVSNFDGEIICSEPMEVVNDDSNGSRDERFNQRHFFNVIESDDQEALNLILEQQKYLRHINAQDANNHDNTPLHMAINRRGKRKVDKIKNKKIIDLLLSKKPDVNIRNNEKMTALDLIETLPLDPHLHIIKQSIEELSFDTPVEVGLKRTVDGDDSIVRKKQKISRVEQKSNRNPYNASGVKRALDGTLYQAKLLGLFAKRGMDKKYDFRLPTEMDAAYKFDDIVFSYRRTRNNDEWSTRFLQAKHKQEPKYNKIKLADLQSTSQKNPFSLQKYLISFCNIMEGKDFDKHKKEDFTILTNTDFAWNTKRSKSGQLNELEKIFIKTDTLLDDEILFIANTEAERYKISDSEKPKLSKMMKSSLAKIALESKIISNQQLIKEAIEVFAYNALNSKEHIDEAQSVLQKARTEYKKCLKMRKGDFINLLKKFSLEMKDILTNDKHQDLNSDIKVLDKIPVKDKVKFLKECKLALKKCKNFHEEGSEEVKKNLSFEIEEGKMAELQRDIDHLKDTKRKLANIIYVANTTSMTDAKKKMNKYFAEDENLKIKEIKKKLEQESEIEKVIDSLENLVSEISTIILFLNKVEIDKYLKQFVEKFRIVVRYPNEEELSALIEQELEDEFHLLNAKFVSESFEKEMLEFLKNYSKGIAYDYTWDSCEAFFLQLKTRINIMMTSGLSMIYPEELRSYEIVAKEHIHQLNDFFKSSKQILLIDTKYTLLSAIKVLQTLESTEFRRKFHCLCREDGYIFLPLKTLLLVKPQDFVVKSFCEVGSHHILVIDFQSSTYTADNDQKEELFHRLKRALQNTDLSNKKIIIIAAKKELLQFDNPYEIGDNGIQFKDLTLESQRDMLKREVTFQGRSRRLVQIIDEPVACIIVHQESLIKLVEKDMKKKIQIGNVKAFDTTGCRKEKSSNTTAYIKDYYIDRRLHRQKIQTECLKKNIKKYFKHCSVFFITGVNENYLHELSGKTNFMHRWESREKWSSMRRKGIIWTSSVGNNEHKFNEICQLFVEAKYIHWLEYIDGDLFWREFSGKIKDFNFTAECIEQSYVPSKDDLMNKKKILEEDFFTNVSSLKPKVIILANDSGMGKSLALTSIARKTVDFDNNVGNDDFTNLWIIRIDLIDHAKQEKESSLGNINRYWTKEECIEFMSKMAILGNPKKDPDIRMQRELFKAILLHSTKDRKQPEIIIHFDGFDEICSLSSTKMKFEYRENTIAMLKVLKKDCSVTQFWITTRFHEKFDLEKELETTAFILSPLTRDEQEEFSNKFWKWNIHFFKGKPGAVCSKLVERLKNIQSSLEQLSSDNSDSLETLRKITEARTYLNSYKRPNKRHLKEATDKIKNLDFSQYITLLLDKFDKEFTNVPLHLQMLVEVVFEKEVDFMKSFGLLDLYGGFVEIKLKHHIERYEMKQSNAKQAKPFEKAYKDLFELHINLARDLYIPVVKEKRTEDELDKTDVYVMNSPSMAKKKNTQADDDLVQQNRYLTKAGLLKESDEGLLEFLRPTYAEYFFTEYLIQNLRLLNVQKKLLKEVLLIQNYEPVRHLINGHLEKLYYYKAQKERLQNEGNNKSTIKKRLSETKGNDLKSLLSVKFRDVRYITTQNDLKDESKRRNILHVMVEEHLLKTIRFLFDKLKNEKEVVTRMLQATDSKSHKTALQLAIDSDSLLLIIELLQNMKEILANDVFNTFLFPNDSGNKSEYAQKSILQMARKLNKPETFEGVKLWLHKNLERTTFDKLQAADKDSQENDLLLKSSPSDDKAFQFESNYSLTTNHSPKSKENTLRKNHQIEFESPVPHPDLKKSHSQAQKTSSLSSPTTSQIQTPKVDLPSMIRTPMVNLGNTCFMASVLQTLFHMPAFTNDLINYNKHKEGCPCTLCLLTTTFKATNPISTKRTPFKPNAMKEHLITLSENFAPGQQQDAHEYFNCLFNEVSKHNVGQTILKRNWRLLEQINSSIKCMSAECQTFAEHETNELEYLYNVIMLDINHNETLNDALEEHFNEEQKQWSTCSRCKISKTNKVQNLRIIEAPKFLSIIFKRFTVNHTKNSKPIQFNSKHLLDLSKWQQNQKQILQYRLIGAITHTGDSIHNGHYFAVVSGGDGKYYKFDDDNPVQDCKMGEATKAYMLFFEKVEDDIISVPATCQTSNVSANLCTIVY